MTESPYPIIPPSREKALDKSLSVSTIKHSTGDKEHERLKSAIKNIIAFGYHESVDGVIYQYQEKNQRIFWDSMATILDGSAMIEPVVEKNKTDTFRLENLVTPPNPLVTAPVVQEPPKKSGGNMFTRFFGDKKEGKSNDPYQIILPSIFDILNKIKRLDLFIEYQSYGVKHASRHSFRWMNRYRRFHYNRFQFVVAPTIIRKHRQYLESAKDIEKQYAVILGSANDRIMHQTRNDMNLNPNQQQ